MDHQEAVRQQLVERYMLGELTTVQQDEFEAHLFVCPQCSEELRAAAILVDNARAVFRAEAGRPSGADAAEARQRGGGAAPGFLHRLAQWMTLPPVAQAAALTLLLAVVCYQNLFQIPSLRGDIEASRAPREVPAFALLPVTRGDDQVLTVPSGARSVVVSFDLTAPGDSGHVCVFIDESGREWLKLEGAPAPGKEMITLQLDPARIPAGRHQLNVRTPTGRELGRFRFTYRP
jgi:anti-sigma factor RsiW